MRSILRVIFAIALLLGGGGGDWTQAASRLGAMAPESCCCGTPAGMPDRCPCPKPDTNRGSSPSTCLSNSAVSLSTAAVRRSAGQRRIEPRPEPADWARGTVATHAEAADLETLALGRDPDLGRHLARLSTHRI